MGKENEGLLTHRCNTMAKVRLYLTCPEFVDTVFSLSNRQEQTLRNWAGIQRSRQFKISGRKAFQQPIAQGVLLLHAIQDIYRDTAISVA